MTVEGVVGRERSIIGVFAWDNAAEKQGVLSKIEHATDPSEVDGLWHPDTADYVELIKRSKSASKSKAP